MSQNAIFTVSQLNRQVRQLLESEMGTVWLTGEISNFMVPASGHWYFSLKDDKAQIKCAMFRGNNSRVRMRPANGAQVLIKARLSLYEPRGDFQVIAELMEPAGEGMLKQQFEALKLELNNRGWFDPRNKQPIPENPGKVGVITSATGAALHDILTVLKRRSPATQVIIYPTLVQGQNAAAQIAAAIDLANHRKEVDVLLVGRGGGSLEDLWCFNEEVVAESIFYSALPVISAVGHEVDVTISDFVADLRAATPSAAAEIVSQDQSARTQQLKTLTDRLQSAQRQQFAFYQQQYAQNEQALRHLHPQRQIERQAQRLDEATLQIKHALLNQIQRKQAQVDMYDQRLSHGRLPHDLAEKQNKISNLLHALEKSQVQNLNRARQTLAQQASTLDAVSPLAVLARGYSITSDSKGLAIKSVDQLQTGQLISTRLNSGIVHSRVESVDTDAEG